LQNSYSGHLGPCNVRNVSIVFRLKMKQCSRYTRWYQYNAMMSDSREPINFDSLCSHISSYYIS